MLSRQSESKYNFQATPTTMVCVQIDDNYMKRSQRVRYGIRAYSSDGVVKWWTRTKFLTVKAAQDYLDELGLAMGWSHCCDA